MIRGTSTYTVLGFTGYAVASLLAAVLFDAWQLPLVDRMARRLVANLWPGGESVLGRTPDVIHVIAARGDRASG